MPEKIAVIGAGAGGLAVAVRLAAMGHRVEVFEKNDGPGGKISEIKHQGFRFDTGPSLFTLPGLVEELYDIAGSDFSTGFPFRKLEKVCRYFFPDGMVIDAHGDRERFIGELASRAGESPRKVAGYLDRSREVFDLTYPVFIGSSLHLIRNYLSMQFLRATMRIYRLKPFSTLHELHRKTFRNSNVVQLFDRFATYNGSDPYKTPATMMVIPHLEHNLGAYFPDHGMYQVASSLERLGTSLGVSFHYGAEVEEILTAGRQKAVAGIRFRTKEGEELNRDFSRVVTDLDIYFVYRKLLPSLPFPVKRFRSERSTSALIFYWGMKTASANLDLHNILFSARYRDEFDCLFRRKTVTDDPTVYIFISSKAVKGDAPDGCENWFVMINVPENDGQDWDEVIVSARQAVENKILRMTGIDPARHRQFEFVSDPRDIESRTASFRGSLYGNSSNSIFSAFSRHPNFSPVRGLYHAGGSVHPGGGIPLCLASAKIVAGMIPSDCKTKMS